MLVDAVDGQTVELVQGAHPFGVTLGQVVVHSDHVDAAAAQGIQINGKGRHEGLTLTGGHFGNSALVQDGTTEELNVVVHHVPRDGRAGSRPRVVPNRLISLQTEPIKVAVQGAIDIRGGDGHGTFGPAAGGFADDGKGFRKDFFEHRRFCHNG